MSQATLVRVPSPPGLAQRDGVLAGSPCLHRLGRALVPRRLRLRRDRGRRRRRRGPRQRRLRRAVTKAFGDGFWSLIPFTMQMAFVTIGGYVVATSPPAQRLIDRFALHPQDRPAAPSASSAP